MAEKTAAETAAATSEAAATAAAAAEAAKGKGAAGAAAGADGKGAAETAGADAAAKAASDAAALAAKQPPAKYELTLPDKGHLVQEDIATIEGIARKAGWTNEEAQAAINEHNEQLEAQSARWATETKADKDLGGDKLEQTQLHTKAGIDFLFPKGDPHREGFINFLNRGGAGNNINVVRALARIGKQQVEDGNVSGSGSGAGGSGQQKSAEDTLYGKPASS